MRTGKNNQIRNSTTEHPKDIFATGEPKETAVRRDFRQTDEDDGT